jgi:guanylate kinase
MTIGSNLENVEILEYGSDIYYIKVEKNHNYFAGDNGKFVLFTIDQKLSCMEKNKMSELRILGRKGDTKISWNRRSELEATAAKETFEKRIKEGWSAFREKAGIKGDKIKIFDPDAERIILVPPISGG